MSFARTFLYFIYYENIFNRFIFIKKPYLNGNRFLSLKYHKFHLFFNNLFYTFNTIYFITLIYLNYFIHRGSNFFIGMFLKAQYFNLNFPVAELYQYDITYLDFRARLRHFIIYIYTFLLAGILCQCTSLYNSRIFQKLIYSQILHLKRFII